MIKECDLETGKESQKGIFCFLKSLLERNRLGELLVINGALTPSELRRALQAQKAGRAPLGHILVEQKIVSRPTLYKTLGQQYSLRCFALAMGMFVTLAGFSLKSARANTIKDVPAKISLVSAAQPAFSSPASFPRLFGSEERRSSDIAPFTKWTGMFDRFERALYQPAGKKVVSAWQRELEQFQGLPLETMVRKVNSYINEQTYILDNNNWGKSDYWSTPIEFFQRGGDCEDFAIAKYASLRALGVPEERLRVAIVHDLEKDIPHAILIVYTDGGAMILDNQAERAKFSRAVNRYKPIFSINRHAWWLHTQGEPTRIASAR